jgi:hypothetical protein
MRGYLVIFFTSGFCAQRGELLLELKTLKGRGQNILPFESLKRTWELKSPQIDIQAERS